MDSKNSPAPVERRETGKNPTDRGKLGGEDEPPVDQAALPFGGAYRSQSPRHKVSAVELIVSIGAKASGS